MGSLKIKVIPDVSLRTVCKPILRREFDNKLRSIINEMKEVMYNSGGVGIAASQVGISKRIIVIDISNSRDDPLILINPEYISIDGSIQSSIEGCLSVENFSARVLRLNRISVEGLNEFGEIINLKADGLLSACIQHECDHLNGVLFIDYLNTKETQKVVEST
ncbi:peptide deformylase [Vibrio mediterranei]|uniref:Peptide deformylase n=1 Tax=Vibrio mediterranei TaxID=689 RepID=A0AAN1FMN6_9VIBR|nr:peptide deformylase [Vibrio mediterranei]ASI93200.1 peptide deformylase [Vibrio mediterranei]